MNTSLTPYVGHIYNAAVASFVCRNTYPLHYVEVCHPLMRHGDFAPFERSNELATHKTLNFNCYVLFHDYEVAIIKLLSGEIIDVKLANLDLPQPPRSFFVRKSAAAKRPRPLSKAAQRQQLLEAIADEL